MALNSTNPPLRLESIHPPCLSAQTLAENMPDSTGIIPFYFGLNAFSSNGFHLRSVVSLSGSLLRLDLCGSIPVEAMELLYIFERELHALGSHYIRQRTTAITFANIAPVTVTLILSIIELLDTISLIAYESWERILEPFPESLVLHGHPHIAMEVNIPSWGDLAYKDVGGGGGELGKPPLDSIHSHQSIDILGGVINGTIRDGRVEIDPHYITVEFHET